MRRRRSLCPASRVRREDKDISAKSDSGIPGLWIPDVATATLIIHEAVRPSRRAECGAQTGCSCTSTCRAQAAQQHSQAPEVRHKAVKYIQLDEFDTIDSDIALPGLRNMEILFSATLSLHNGFVSYSIWGWPIAKRIRTPLLRGRLCKQICSRPEWMVQPDATEGTCKADAATSPASRGMRGT